MIIFIDNVLFNYQIFYRSSIKIDRLIINIDDFMKPILRVTYFSKIFVNVFPLKYLDGGF